MEENKQLVPKNERDEILSCLTDEILTHYKIIKKIGTGGMHSVVYLAENLDYKENNYFSTEGKFAAIKIVKRNEQITDEDWKRFNDECITTIRVNSIPNVIQTYHIYKNDNKQAIIIVMEYMDGFSLRDIINHENHLSINESLFIFRKIIVALDGLHSFKQRIIHRDLKPENVLLSSDRSKVKIIDFGISSVVLTGNTVHSKKFITNERDLYGTYPYISPDLLNAFFSNKIDQKFLAITPQSDFYSAGVILYEMIVGEKPFRAEKYDNPEIIKLPLQYDLPSVHRNNPKVPIAVENIIFRCLASKKEDVFYRYHNAKEIIKDIDDAFKNIDKPNEGTLLKPYSQRVIQSDNFNFNPDLEKQKLKFYNTKWFFLCVSLVFCVLIVTGLIILIVNLT